MNDYGYYRRCEIPAFGSWDCYDGLPITQCFDTASRQPAATDLLRYSYSHDRDLYVAGDLYANDVVTPAMIVVPRRRRRKVRVVGEDVDAKGGKGARGQWVGSFGGEPPSPTPPFVTRQPPKPVDEDLYKIPPDLLYAKSKKKKRGLKLLRCCMMPADAM
ncbi:hypothetical protein SAY86_016055 [Trapa natans]|uniref:Uncharacterized protein n=1 Tax=Trapa natans TaxID=22666 RepID=A0AAN7R137_TRANT|nr:hypothetical protein SAY86_016055 [Trapa natans]